MKGLAYYLNIASLCIYSFTPLYLYDKNISIPLIAISFGFWLISSFQIEHGWVKRCSLFYVPLAIILFVEGLYCLALSVNYYVVLTSSFLAYTWLFIWQFYNKHLEMLKWPLIFFVLIILIDGIDTIKGNILFPGASRQQADLYDATEASQLLFDLHIGGFPLLYSLAFLIFPLCLSIKYKLANRLFCTGLLIFNFIVLFYGSYFISLIISFVFLLVSLPKINYLKRNLIWIGASICLLLLTKDYIMDGVIYIGDLTGSSTLVQHAEEIKSGGATEQGVTGGRSKLYLGALLNFLEHPILGKMSGWTIGHASGHSELLEYFEKFGLLGCAFVYFWIVFYRTLKKEIHSIQVNKYSFVFFLVILFFLFVDPLRREQPLSMVIFCIIPLALKYIDEQLIKRGIDNV